MFSNGNFFIFLIIFEYTSFIKFLLAKSTNPKTNEFIINDNYNKNYSEISTTTTTTTVLKTDNNIYNNLTQLPKTILSSIITTEITATTTNNNDNSFYMEKLSGKFDKTHQQNFKEHFQQQPQEQNLKFEKNRKENINSEIDKENKIKLSTIEILPEPEPLFSPPPQSASSTVSQQQQQQKLHQLMQQQPSAAAATQNALLPIFPERSDAVYFIVAVIGGAKLWGRILARTLLDMGPPFHSPLGPPLRPLYVDLPLNGRFSVKVLTSLCQQIENVPLAGVVVIGDGHSARAVALSGNAMKVPVLWARGGTANIHGARREAQELQSMLQPSAREILIAIRALFLQAHWHSFFVISDPDATVVLTGSEGSSLREPPLHPKILPLKQATDSDIFRQLAEISRSTRGIVLLLCNLISARKIMSQAKRLNMAGGHFIWLWADTSSTTEFFDYNQHSSMDEKILEYPEAIKQYTMSSSSSHSNVVSSVPSSFSSVKINDYDGMLSSSAKSSENFSDADNSDTDNRGRGRGGGSSNVMGGEVDFDDMEMYNFHHGYKNDPSTFLKDKSQINPFQKFQPSTSTALNKQQQKHRRKQQQQQQQQQQVLSSLIRPSVNSGRYVFGLKRNIEDNSEEEIISNKGKRSHIKNNKNIFINNHDDIYHSLESVEDISENIDDTIKIKLNNGANLRHLGSDGTLKSDKTSSSSSSLNYDPLFDYNDRTNDNNHNLINNTDSSNKNNKPEMMSSSLSSSSIFYHHQQKQQKQQKHHEKNSTILTSNHVLFHHFEDFPIGLLALKPVKMLVDRNFVKSTIRLFALTWSRTEQEHKFEFNKNNNNNNNDYDELFENYLKTLRYHSHDRNTNNNPYVTNFDNNNNQSPLLPNWSNSNQLNRSIRKQQQQQHIKRFNRNVNNYKIKSETVNKQQQQQQKYLNEIFLLNKKKNNTHFNNKINDKLNNDYNLNINHNISINENLNRNLISKKNILINNDSSISSHILNSRTDHNIENLKFNISSYNQNLSGLINEYSNRFSNDESNNNRKLLEKINLNIIKNHNTNTNNNSNDNNNRTNDVNSLNSSKIKRYNKTWWSTSSSVSASSSSSSSSSQPSRESYNRKFNREQQYLNQQHQKQQSTSGVDLSGNDGGGGQYRKYYPYYKGGCFGTINDKEIKKSEDFAKALKLATKLALSGQKLPDGNLEKSLITNFELLNLVPDDNSKNTKYDLKASIIRRRGPHKPENGLSKWHRVGLISGVNVQLDTIVWPGGDIVVSGISARARTIFRIVTALAPPFVMESELDEDGLCLRGLPCHRLSPTGQHNLTLMFNVIETRDRLREDAVEHGVKPPQNNPDNTYDNSLYETKCCYGLSMDLLDNIATELGFEFHLYIAQDELFGTKYSTLNDEFMHSNRKESPPYSKKFNRLKNSNNWNRRDQYHQHNQYNNYPVYSTLDDEINEHHNYHDNHQQYRHDNKKITESSRYDKNDDQFDNDDENSKEKRIFHEAFSHVTNYDRRKNMNAEYVDKFLSTSYSSKEIFNEKNNESDEDEKNTDEIYEMKNIFDWSETERRSESSKHNRKFSNKKQSKAQWNGIIGDLMSGSADMSFAPLSVSKSRSEVIDFSVPYFHSGVTLLAAPQSRSEIPLLAFLLPFSPELWIAIFTSLNVTAIAVAIYEWLSPFGLNPWGRQRSKNFSMSSALWVMWGLLCGHLVAFKAPKSWPNKFLINVWGGFSVIFIASYTANIAALIAGLFFHNAGNRPEVALLTSRVGTPTASATETYVKKKDPHIWEHMKKYTIRNIEEGIRGLKNGSLDLIMGDTPILDYYRATDHGCTLQRIGEPYVHDTYAIGMTKGFPLKESISALIAKYSSNGYLDILTEKWYGGLPCFKDSEFLQPRPLGVEAVAGVFLLLGLGIMLGVLILILEYLFYKYTLPILRHKPKGTVWRSRNIMFFSQKLYRFINCVELVSPHHAARELVHTLRQGQIASLFQKSIKRKEDEQRRRRKSKAQFFEMIQEIRRVQQQERANPKLEVVTEDESVTDEIKRPSESHYRLKLSPKPKLLFGDRKESSRSRSNSSVLNIRRFSTDSILSERLDTIGRRLSRDLTNSPPDLGRRFKTFGKNHENKFDTYCGTKASISNDYIEETKFDTYSGKNSEKPTIPIKKHQNKRVALNSETFANHFNDDDNDDDSININCKNMKKINETQTNRDDIKTRPIPIIKESLIYSICQEDNNKIELRDRMNEELKNKYDEVKELKQDDDDNHGEAIYSKVIKNRTVRTRSVSNQTNISAQQQQQQQYQYYHMRQKTIDGNGKKSSGVISIRGGGGVISGTSGYSSIETRPLMPIPILRVETIETIETIPPVITTTATATTPTSQSSLSSSSSQQGISYNSSSSVALPSKVSQKSNLKQISLERLSKEDLLKLSESSQSEIHDYLCK